MENQVHQPGVLLKPSLHGRSLQTDLAEEDSTQHVLLLPSVISDGTMQHVAKGLKDNCLLT